MGFGEQKYKLKAEDKATFCSPVEIKAPVLVSKNTEERTFVVDSGASMHMLSRKDLSSDEMDTLRRSRTPTTVVTANGEVQTHEEAQGTRIVIIFQQLFGFHIETNGSDQFFRWIRNIIRSNDDSKCQACMRETDADNSWQASLEKP